jgi:ribosomal protein S18 acetylase RimI-like enzyme
MPTNLNKLFRLNKEHVKIAGEMAARAYFDDPVNSNFFPDVEKRKKNFHYMWDVSIRSCVLYGETYAPTSNIEGIAGWIYHEKFRDSIWRDIRSGAITLIFKASGLKLKQLRKYYFLTAKMHRSNVNFPHWELSQLAVDPEHQGKGYASKLLKPMLARIDQEELPCYLNTQKENNVSFYQNFGFELIDSKTLEGTDMRAWALLRNPE